MEVRDVINYLLTYFDARGRWVAAYEVESGKPFENIVAQVRGWKNFGGQGALPGLRDGPGVYPFDGYILVKGVGKQRLIV